MVRECIEDSVGFFGDITQAIHHFEQNNKEDVSIFNSLSSINYLTTSPIRTISLFDVNELASVIDLPKVLLLT